MEKKKNYWGKKKSCGLSLYNSAYVLELDMMHDANPRSWEALAGGHRFERSQSCKERSCLKGEEKKKKNPKNERTRKGRGGEMEGKREGKKLQRHGKFPLWISVFHYSTEFWLFLRWL